MGRNLLKNSIQCPICKDIIISYSTHDFKRCSCKNISIDGGRDYQRYSWKKEKPKNLAVYDDGSHKTRRNALYWGTNYDKNNHRLKETLWRAIKDLDTNHIWKILELFDEKLPKLYQDTFTDEIIFREQKYYAET